MCQKGSFRYDLYYRLNVMSIQIPPLRERIDDIKILIDFLLKKLSYKLSKTHIHISPEALDSLEGYHWPGNIRELENVLERAIILADKGIIRPDQLAIPVKINLNKSNKNNELLKTVIENAEKDTIVSCLNRVKGNRSETARILGISRSSLYDRIKRLSL